ncbi:hypothetical protein [Shouchella miscanthi]|uniref:hypothetical protein n=1 Tax=Shouchella miscanthi TaxID=2598861 RepID=UPI001643B1A1|nr:hypothetical protein [Shouchella miscanthi]
MGALQLIKVVAFVFKVYKLDGIGQGSFEYQVNYEFVDKDLAGEVLFLSIGVKVKVSNGEYLLAFE